MEGEWRSCGRRFRNVASCGVSVVGEWYLAGEICMKKSVCECGVECILYVIHTMII